ncbi:hypothetical protein OW763_03170 [Clostridium aestuarii]|uniref:30S ribosomal protein S27ae n=1 Tax=Clostridium aestuarii TaxID=338193 RepID=A0ABT4CWZ3_9CLOT|nr:hypothetical protein [Clostridium aestuarii]MCY6483357.1 hypothetical protein [Clostridium aestuarii]
MYINVKNKKFTKKMGAIGIVRLVCTKCGRVWYTAYGEGEHKCDSCGAKLKHEEIKLSKCKIQKNKTK